MYYEDISKAEKYWEETLGRAAGSLEKEIEEGKVKYEEHEAINRLGILYAKQGDSAKAEKLFREAAQKAPSKASYWNNLANVLLLMGNIEEADKYYQQAEKQGGSDPYIYFNRAIFYFAQQEKEKAIQAIQDAKEKSPEIYKVLEQELGIITGEGRAADEDVTGKAESIMGNWDDKKQRLAKVEELLKELTEGESEEVKQTYETVLMALSKEEMQELLKLDKQQILEKLKPKEPVEGQLDAQISKTQLQELVVEAIGRPAEGGTKVRAAGISEPEDLRWWLSWLQ
jgi:tetratricopeptide (TPR) repeat protein